MSTYATPLVLLVLVGTNGCMSSKYVKVETTEQVLRTRPAEVMTEDHLVDVELAEGGPTFVESEAWDVWTVETVQEETWDRRPWHWKQSPKQLLGLSGTMLGTGLVAIVVGALATDESDESRGAAMAVGGVLVAGSPVPLGILGVRAAQAIDTRRPLPPPYEREVARSSELRAVGPYSGSLRVTAAAPGFGFREEGVLPVPLRAGDLAALPYLPPGLPGASPQLSIEGYRLVGVEQSVAYRALADRATAEVPRSGASEFARTYTWWTEPHRTRVQLVALRTTSSGEPDSCCFGPDPFLGVELDGVELGCTSTAGSDVAEGTHPLARGDWFVADFTRASRLHLSLWDEEEISGRDPLPQDPGEVWGVPASGSVGPGELKVSSTRSPPGGGLTNCAAKGRLSEEVKDALLSCAMDTAVSKLAGFVARTAHAPDGAQALAELGGSAASTHLQGGEIRARDLAEDAFTGWVSSAIAAANPEAGLLVEAGLYARCVVQKSRH